MGDRRFKVLDLFCGAGGVSVGLHRAGFEVVGVDINPQPRYPFKFIQADVREIGTRRSPVYIPAFDFVSLSPPCQLFSLETPALHRHRHTDLIVWSRVLMRVHGKPYMIENVGGARRHLESPLMLCGTMFGLPVWRHRYFETNVPMSALTPPCNHSACPEPVDVTGTGGRRLGNRPDGGGGNSRKPRGLDEARRALGIDWMNRKELSQAIPPAYSEHLGRQVMSYLTRQSERAA